MRMSGGAGTRRSYQAQLARPCLSRMRMRVEFSDASTVQA